MLFKKLWRTMKLYKTQFISMVIMITLGVGIFVGFNMEWASIERNRDFLFEHTGYADYRILSENGFTREDLEKIINIKGVRNATRFLSVSVDVQEQNGDGVTLTVTEDKDISGCYLMQGEEYDPNSTNGIWLSDQYADANHIYPGDTITFIYKDIEFCGIVKGLIKAGEHLICVRDESQLMPDYSTYGFAFISPVMYSKAGDYAFYPQIHVISDMDKKEFIKEADKALGKTTMIVTKEESASYLLSEGEIEEGKTMGSILPVLFLLIAVLTMVTTMHRLTAKEKTQIGTLKALGFQDRRILCHYTSYAFMVAIFGIIFGVVFGYGIAWFIMNPNGMMGTYMDMPEWKLCMPEFCYIILPVMIVLLTGIGFLSVKQMLKGTAIEALRPYTPKKMKPMWIEKTKLFHQFSFGTRWNMRDVMRHKSRTAMSLIGIIGGMILIVASLGMGDTMDAFLTLYYDGAANYSSRIYFSEDAEKEQRDEIIEKYHGDWSASCNVQIEEKAVSFDIYKITYDKVRFPDENGDYIQLQDNGAYICLRLAEEFNLSIGDEFMISPYGSDREYSLKVAGKIRSVSESIVVTSKYAEILEIPFIADSVYTDTVKADILPQSEIKSIQSKQMIVDSFDQFIEIMDMMIFVLILGALVLSLVVLYNLGIMSYTERYKEMATLKVVGFQDKKIGRLLIGQNLGISFIGIIIGLPAGISALDYLLKALAGEYEMKMAVSFTTIFISIFLTLGISLLVSLMVSCKNKKIDMVEALKGTE